MIAEDLPESRVDQVGCCVVFDRRAAPTHINRSQESLTTSEFAPLHGNSVNDQSCERPFRIQNLCEERLTTKVPGITHLTTRFRIEGGLIEDDLALLPRADPLDLFAVSQDRDDRRLQLEAFVAQEYRPSRLRKIVEGLGNPLDIRKRFQMRPRLFPLTSQLRLEPVPIAYDRLLSGDLVHQIPRHSVCVIQLKEFRSREDSLLLRRLIFDLANQVMQSGQRLAQHDAEPVLLDPGEARDMRPTRREFRIRIHHQVDYLVGRSG